MEWLDLLEVVKVLLLVILNNWPRKTPFPSGRSLVNDEEPSYEDRTDPRKKMVAQLSQNMNFLADMTVGDFLSLHAKCRGASNTCVDRVVKLANTLTGEPIKRNMNLQS